MAEFSKVMHEWRRLCKSYSGCVQCVLWSKCPTPSRDYWPIEDYVSIEKTIMAWAAEHPEPIYPTWLKFVKCHKAEGRIEETDGEFVLWMAETQIPADMAEKLGIEPENIFCQGHSCPQQTVVCGD